MDNVTWEQALEFMRAVGFSIEYDAGNSAGNVAVFGFAESQDKVVMMEPPSRGWLFINSDSLTESGRTFEYAFDEFLYKILNDPVLGGSAVSLAVQKRYDALRAEAVRAHLEEVCAFFREEIGASVKLSAGDAPFFLVGGENNDDIRIDAPWLLCPYWTVRFHFVSILHVGSTLRETWEKAKKSLQEEMKLRNKLLRAADYI